MKAIFGILDLVPGWVYALALAAALAWGGVNAFERNLARSGEAAAKVMAKANADALESARLQVDLNKKQAARLLADETAKVAATETRLANALAKLEKTDVANKTTVAGLKTRLVAAAGAAGRLRDPYGAPDRCGASGGDAKGQTATSADDSPANGAAPGRLLSAELSGFIEQRLAQADALNIAYASCRADAFTVRQ
jgi:hypothetical protein